MLSQIQLNEIREHLEKAQNPVFFFDNDVDGLMSFILLRRYIGRGKGVAIKSFPELDESYVKRIDEFNSDYVFILDKPIISKKFVEQVAQKNIPIVWIDHHDVHIEKNKDFSYYNPAYSKNKSNEPISYITYKVVNRKEDIWIAMAGCLGDNFMPEFTQEFSKIYSRIWKKDAQSPFEILYESEFGKLIMMLDFSLKDKTSNVVSMINFLFKVNSPTDILVESSENFNIFKRYNEVRRIYERLFENAKKVARSSKKVIFFQYSADISLTANLANELSYRFPGKIVIVTHVKGGIANISIRGKEDVRNVTLKAINSIEGATGGGHKNATGAKMNVDNLKKFKEFFENEFEK